MDAAYDHIQEEVLRPEVGRDQPAGKQPEGGSLNTEIQEAYESFSASPWGARLGGFLGSVRKQGEGLYQGARQEAVAASEEALKGFSDLKSTLVSRARSLSIENSLSSSTASTATVTEKGPADEESEATKKERTASDALRESESLVTRFRIEAAKRLKEIEKAEDAADEALLKFGTNIRNFLRDAVSIAPPTEEKDKDGNSTVLFESKDQDGKRVIHTTRFAAQLHAIHSSLDSFLKDPDSDEYQKWAYEFDVEKKTGDIATELEKYEELRRAMEKLVPEKVEYGQFWKRYCFLRMVVESEEQRRRELLKGATLSPVEEVAWDEDSDSEPSTPQPRATPKPSSSLSQPPNHTSSTTPSAPSTIEPTVKTADVDAPKPNEPRKSQDLHSQPDSDASYDLVSGATSQAPPSPREEKLERKKVKKEGEESEEEDWE